ncbi:MAG TPA: farnesyl diphosphate synthase [Casimicrobiaceae bacterium]|nr:farnesyl diphosphate synthase [Casimicrobiaceae bacterium]
MNPEVDWQTWSRSRQEQVEAALEQALPAGTQSPESLHAAMRYAVLGGGKRVRPLLAYASGELTGADPRIVDAVAVAVELMHAYSLVHDDLPCMDDDALRRGKPTCHVAFGEATALLAGDALQSLAFSVLAHSKLRNAGEACALLADMAGAGGMAGGQAIDLAAVGAALSLPDLERMHRMKTGALIRAAVLLGATCGSEPDASLRDALDAYARAAGLAFQVVDDILDVEGSAASLGKTAGKDAAHGKPTFVSVLGLEAAKSRAEELRAEAHAALARYGRSGRRLTELADRIVDRHS